MKDPSVRVNASNIGKTMQIRTVKWAILGIIFLALTNASAQVTLVSISPSAEEITNQFPPPPPRMFSFIFKATKGTDYTLVFSTPAEPAVVVGVGADISSTAFDSATNQLTVNLTFDRSVVPAKGKSFPSNAFLLSIDPGAPRSFNPQPRPPSGPPGRQGDIGPRAAATSDECYGPLGTAPSADKPGPPLESAGTFMSTNLAEWCIIPPNESEPFFGFKLRAPSGTRGFFKKKLSPGLVTLLSTLSGKTLNPDSLGIFNGDVQASKSITLTSDGGALISIDVKFLSSSTEVFNEASGNRASATTTTSRVTKTLTTSEEEELSLAPKNFKVTTARASLYGFVDDPTGSAGQTVTIQRSVNGKLTTVGTATINSDGSYSTKISASKLFKKSGTVSTAATVNLSKITLIASTISNLVKTSMQVTLQNRVSSLRR